MTTSIPQSQQRVEPLRQLLPCPLCGEKRIFLNEPSQWHRYGSINCPACLLVLPGEVIDQKELINCWNDRAPIGSVDAQDELTEALDAIQAQCDEMRSLKGWRLNLIRESLAKARAALSKGAA